MNNQPDNPVNKQNQTIPIHEKNLSLIPHLSSLKTSPFPIPQNNQIYLEKDWFLNILHQRIATITYRGVRKTTYFGFNTQQEAELFKNSVLKIGACSAIVVRKSQRLSQYQYECKCWNCSTELIVYLLNLVKVK